LPKWHTIKGTTRPLNVPITVALPNLLLKRTGKGLHHSNIHLRDSMTSIRKTVMDIMILGRATMISTSSQAMARELVHEGRIHRKIKAATLRNKDIMVMADPEVAEIQDHKGVLIGEEAQIMGDLQQRMVVEVDVEVEVEVEEVTLMVRVRP
jgi:hypothetical protein